MSNTIKNVKSALQTKEEEMSHSINQEIRELRGQVEDLANMLKSQVKSAAHTARKAIDEESNIINLTAEDVAQMAKKAGKQARAFVEDTIEEAEEVYAEVEDKIHRNPLQSLLIAVAGGLLLGSLLRK
ncbi:MAG: hypothetical protein EB059_03825 [Alphaproteobacteria bacterium]|nr:hypothetical protein [Alphaproteobacteria bacterium]